MKKATWIFTIIITVLHFQSCKENEITGEDKLNEKFLAIEKKVQEGDLNQENFLDPFEEIHMDFLFNLAGLTQLSEYDTFQQESELFVTLHDQKVLKSGNVVNNNKRILSKAEELLFNSYVRALRSNKLISKIRITEHYINEIQKLEYLHNESKNYITYAIGFHRSLMIFVDIDNKEKNVTKKSASRKDWLPCASRECWDCCMFRWTQGMDNWNTVEWVRFLASPAVNTAWEAASCANDCFF
jgi:hypothetical protein